MANPITAATTRLVATSWAAPAGTPLPGEAFDGTLEGTADGEPGADGADGALEGAVDGEPTVEGAVAGAVGVMTHDPEAGRLHL